MGKTLVIAEKPSAGADIAKVLGCSKKEKGYIEGERYIVTWAIGHLIGQKLPEEHNTNYKAWKLEDLPFHFPLQQSLKILPNTAEQFKVIKELIHRPDVELLINAGDAGREGYLIQEWIYRMAGNNKPKKVLWASSLTDEALRKAFASLKEPQEFEGLLREAEARAHLDYLLGINYTRALSLKNDLSINGKRAIIHYGRCQTPLLKLISDREDEIKKFVPTPYYEVEISYTKGFSGRMIDAEKNIERFESSEEAETIIKEMGQSAVIASYQEEERRTSPPPLYNLADLQKDMGRKYGYTAEDTLAIAQALYEKYKVISYPRTDSKYLSTDLYNEIDEHLKSLNFSNFMAALKNIKQEKIFDKRYFNDLKVTDHHALIPTINSRIEVIFNELTEPEQRVFSAIAYRFIAIFCPDYQYKATEIITEESGHRFLSRGNTILHLGYKAVLRSDENEEKKEMQILPELQTGDLLRIDHSEVLAKKTKAPAAYNVASIISLMESYNIGTSATRAEILKKLLGKVGDKVYEQKAFLRLNKNVYVVTELGKKVLQLIPDQLKDPELTNYYETVLKNVNSGEVELSSFLGKLLEEQKRQIILFQEQKEEIVEEGKIVIKCPKCGRPIREMEKVYRCSGWNEGCNFTIWRNIAGKKLTPAQAAALITKGKTGKISGFKKRDGGTFSAALSLEDGKVQFLFINKK